jgi:hypothetical protein
MRCLKRAMLVVGLLTIHTPDVWAYTGLEHQRVSHDALCLALDYLGFPRCSIPPRDGGSLSLPGDSCEPSGRACCRPLSLTDLDEANLWTLLGEPASSAASEPGYPPRPKGTGSATPANVSYAEFVAFVDRVVDPIKLMDRAEGTGGLPRYPSDLDEDFLTRLRKRRSPQLFAAQGNDSHFQAQAMMSWWLWHRQAVLAAAYGDATQQGPSEGRERLFAGLLMNAISNHYLEDSLAPGHIFTPREGMHDFAAISMHDFYNREGACFAVDKDRWGELADLIDPERHAQLLGMRKEILESIKGLGFPQWKLRLLGDGYLIPSERKIEAVPGLEESSQRQRLFITLVVARTIVDVLESHACGEPINKFESYSWSPLQENQHAGKKYQMARAGYPYGTYKEYSVDKVEYGLISSLEISSQSTVSGGVEDTRGVVSAIVIPTFIWAPPPGIKAKNVYVPTYLTPTAALGLSYRLDDDLPGFGAFVRLSLLSPRLDLHVGAAFGVERYNWDAEESYRFHPEVRVGVGASIVSLFGAVGYDHALNAQRELEGSLTVRAGAQLAILWSKLPRRQRVRLQCDTSKE